MWSWSDPLPAIQEVSHVLKRWSKDAVKFGLRAIIPRSLLDIAKESRNLPADRRAAYVKRRLARTVGATRAVSLPSPAASVIFVCHGNIMRSAAAAGFLRDELRAAGIANVKIGSRVRTRTTAAPRTRARRTPRASSGSPCASTPPRGSPSSSSPNTM